MAEDWTWRDDIKSFLRWQPLQTIWDWFWETAMAKAVVGTMIGALIAGGSYLARAPHLALFFSGVLATSIIMLLLSGMPRRGWRRSAKQSIPDSSRQPSDDLITYAQFLKQETEECRDGNHTGTVTVDGVSHIGCTFRDCILKWEGMPFDLDRVKLAGKSEWRTTVGTARQIVKFLKADAYIRKGADFAGALSDS